MFYFHFEECIRFGLVVSAFVAPHHRHRRRRRCRAHQSMTLHKNRIAEIPLAQKCVLCAVGDAKLYMARLRRVDSSFK